jgi:hypothetical protein
MDRDQVRDILLNYGSLSDVECAMESTDEWHQLVEDVVCERISISAIVQQTKANGSMHTVNDEERHPSPPRANGHEAPSEREMDIQALLRVFKGTITVRSLIEEAYDSHTGNILQANLFLLSLVGEGPERGARAAGASEPAVDPNTVVKRLTARYPRIRQRDLEKLVAAHPGCTAEAINAMLESMDPASVQVCMCLPLKSCTTAALLNLQGIHRHSHEKTGEAC